MIIHSVGEIQNKPSLIKNNGLMQIVDKRANVMLGYFISSKYEKQIKPIVDEIEKEEKLLKLKKLKAHQDLEFVEVGVDVGIE